MTKNPLTPKQQRFVEEYLVDLNATQAAIRAGYKEKSAKSTAAKLLKVCGIAKAIATAQAKRSRRTRLSADQVLRQEAAIALCDPRGFFYPEDHERAGEPKSMCDLSEDQAAALASVEVFQDRNGGVRYKFRFLDKNRALARLHKHYGLENGGREDRRSQEMDEAMARIIERKRGRGEE